MLSASLSALKCDQVAIENIIAHYNTQRIARVCMCLQSVLEDDDTEKSIGQLKKAITALTRVDDSGAYLTDIRQLQSSVQALTLRDSLLKRYQAERLETQIKEAVRKMRSCTGTGLPGKQVNNFSGDNIYQQLFSNILMIPDYIEAMTTLAACRKVYMIDNCIFNAFYTALSMSLLVENSTLLLFLSRDYRNCVRLLYYFALIEEVATTLDFIGLNAKLQLRLKALCLSTPSLLEGLRGLDAETILKILNVPKTAATLAPIFTEDISVRLRSYIDSILGSIKSIVVDTTTQREQLHSQDILTQVSTPDKTVCIDVSPSYISGPSDDLETAQSIVNRLAFTASFTAASQEFVKDAIVPSLATILTDKYLEKLQQSIFSLLGCSDVAVLSVCYDNTLIYGVRTFHVPILTEMYTTVLEYSVALTRLESVYKTHEINYNSEIVRAAFIEGLARILTAFQYARYTFALDMDEDLRDREANSDIAKALRVMDADLNAQGKHALSKACVQASRYGLLTYASLLLNKRIPSEQMSSLEIFVLSTFKDALDHLCRMIFLAIFARNTQANDTLVQKYSHLLALATELVLTMFLGCQLSEQYVKEPHGLCISLIVLASHTFSSTLITTAGLQQQQRLAAYDYIAALSKILLHIGGTGQNSLVSRCLGNKIQDAFKYISATSSSQEYEEMCNIYETYGDLYYTQTSLPFAVLGIASKRQKIIATFYKTQDSNALIELVKVRLPNFEYHRFFALGDLSAIVQNCFERDDSAENSSVIHDLVLHIKSGF